MSRYLLNEYVRYKNHYLIGLIPRKEIIGRAKHVVMSLNYDNYYFPRSERFLHKL